MLPGSYPTFIGFIALVFWALAAPFAAIIKNLPAFECLTITFFVSFCFASVKITIYHQWQLLRQPLFMWLTGFLGIYGTSAFYITSFHYAPAAHVDLINNLWPIMVLFFTGFLPHETISAKHLFSATLGFLGLLILFRSKQQGFDFKYLLGYVLALLDALFWAIYTVMARLHGKTPVETIGIYCGIAAFCSFFCHVNFESSVIPTMKQSAILLFMGLGSQCICYFFWEFGIKRGNFKLLAILSYGSPILSVVFLVLLGMTPFSMRLCIACLLITLGGVIGMIQWKRLSDLYSLKKKMIMSNYKLRTRA